MKSKLVLFLGSIGFAMFSKIMRETPFILEQECSTLRKRVDAKNTRVAATPTTAIVMAISFLICK